MPEGRGRYARHGNGRSDERGGGEQREPSAVTGGSGYICFTFRQQLTQDGAVAACFVLAIASYGKVRGMRESGKEIEQVRCVGFVHLRSEPFYKRIPL